MMIDPDTGLYKDGTRFYSSITTSFLTTDPARQGNNWYEYSGNDPADETDPTGLHWGDLVVGNSFSAPYDPCAGGNLYTLADFRAAHHMELYNGASPPPASPPAPLPAMPLDFVATNLGPDEVAIYTDGTARTTSGTVGHLVPGRNGVPNFVANNGTFYPVEPNSGAMAATAVSAGGATAVVRGGIALWNLAGWLSDPNSPGIDGGQPNPQPSFPNSNAPAPNPTGPTPQCEPTARGGSRTPSDILVPGGQQVGVPGASSGIRRLNGGLSEAQSMFDEISAGGQDITPPGYPGKLVELPNGGRVGLRPVSSSADASPSLDVNIPGIPVRKIHFVP